MYSICLRLSVEQVLQLLSQQNLVINLDDIQKQPSCKETVNHDVSFFQLFRDQIKRMKQSGNPRTTETYLVGFRKFYRFCGSKDICMGQITSQLMEDYQAWLRRQNLSLNTISFYLRILRRIYNKALENGMTIDQKPFARVYTGQAKTNKRAISIDEIRKIKSLAIDDKHVAFARDLFLFSFYTRGMSFVDISYLQPSNIRDGMLIYKRRKSSQLLCMRWESEMQEIIERYPLPQNRKYLFPIILKQNGKERNQYRHVQTEVNKHLKTVARMAGISSNLTMYCARHSWASIARQLNIPLEIISRGMGHTHERTTEIYLKSINCQTIDDANRQILEVLHDK